AARGGCNSANGAKGAKGANGADGAARGRAGGGGRALCADRVGGQRRGVLLGAVRAVAPVDGDGAPREVGVRRRADPDAVRRRRRESCGDRGGGATVAR